MATAQALKQSPVQVASMLVGAVFLLVGILGFIPGITQNLGDIKFAGHDSHAELLGIFQVSVLHNVVHLLFGVIGLTAARTSGSARTFLIGGGAIYLALWVYGMAIGHASGANFVPFNTADNWLHLGLGTAMVLVGVTLGRKVRHEVSPA
jgi:arginine exporter protein ArgO